MKQVLYILLASGLTVATSVALGHALLLRVRVKLERLEAAFLSFVLGSAALSAVVWVMAAVGLARRGAFVVAASVLTGFGVWWGRRAACGGRAPAPQTHRQLRWIFWAIYGAYGALYISNAMIPESSIDGSTHYLARVAVWASRFGFGGTGSAPDGVESLFLFAFSIGKFSAAAMVEFLYLLALPLGIFAYARRIGEERAGMVAAMLVFASPVLAVTGTIAAPDVAIATTLFAVFYLIEIARMERQRRLLLPAAVLFAFLAWVMTPWLIREFEKPVLHLNAWYPRLPLDLAVHGERTNGMLGPVFLLIPLALLALRYSAGRRLLAAGVLFATPCLGAMEARVLVASMPFLTLAFAMVVVRSRIAAPALVAAQAIMAWPSFLDLYVHEKTWRLTGSQWAAALRIEPEDQFLDRTMSSYRVGRLLETMVPEGAKILTLSPFQRVYHSRVLWNGEEAGEGRRLREVLWAALVPARMPVYRTELRFPERPAGAFRLLPEVFEGRARWGVNEIRAFRGEAPVRFGLRASPNPADAGYAADGNPTTRWTSTRAAHENMELILDAESAVDRVVIESASDQTRPVRIDGGSSTTEQVNSPPDLRRSASAALKNAGVLWIVAHRDDVGAGDLWARAEEWNIVLRAAERDYMIFQIQ